MKKALAFIFPIKKEYMKQGDLPSGKFEVLI